MPKNKAAEVLSHYWVTHQFPVDPIFIAKKMGLEVYIGMLPPGVSGAIVKRPGEPASIYLDQHDVRQRRRFTCAHELGHYVDHLARCTQVGADMGSYQFVDHRNGHSAAGVDYQEIFANQFAACLLMPEQEVRIRHGQGWSLWQMSDHFDVSNDAMSFRLRNLGIPL